MMNRAALSFHHFACSHFQGQWVTPGNDWQDW